MSAAAIERPPSDFLVYRTPNAIPSTGRLSVTKSAMMAAVYEEYTSNESDSNILLNTMQLVEPRKHSSVPNHLLETKIYSKVGQNSAFQARPAVLNFIGFDIGKMRHLKLDLVNASIDVQRMHIIPPQTRYFRIQYTKKLKMVPGVALSCVVEFCPDECRYYYDCIRVHCKGEENLIIPLHAYPVLNTSEFPKTIDFSVVPIGELTTRVFPLRSVCQVDFEFRLTFSQLHPFFNIEPEAGVVPANSEVDICVTFRPTSFQTATAKVQLEVSQFGMKPLVCQLLGRSVPGLEHDASINSARDHYFSTESNGLKPLPSTLDPSLVSPLARARSRKAKMSPLTARLPTDNLPASELRDGLILPPNLDNPHAVSSVLVQKTGQLKIKDLQEAFQSQNTGSQFMTRQMKEAQFEMAVRQEIFEERQNQLRWQVKCGDDLATAVYQLKVIDDRIEDWKLYKKVRGDPHISEELCRTSSEVIMRRTRRHASSTAPEVAQFDEYCNDMWAARQTLLTKFQQAAYKVVIRVRMIPRLRALQRYLTENGCALATSESGTMLLVQSNLEQSECASKFMFTASRVSSVTFATYTSPTAENDLAVDALGSVLTVPNVISSELTVPFYPLQVPQCAQLCGYGRFDVHQASTNYVIPVSLNCLRIPPDEDQLKTTSKTDVQLKTDEESSAEEKPRNPEPCPATTPVDICAPPALFNPIRYQPQHIFNPAPGLMTMLSPMPYSETDSDFHVCPLPRFIAPANDEAQRLSMTQKQFLDRQDIIKGVMTWKKFPSMAIASTANVPSLSNVWVPRWNDCFNDELLPVAVPELKQTLDEDDCCCVENEEDNGDVQLTMEMVKAEFASMEAACLQDESPTQEPVHGGKKAAPSVDVKTVPQVQSKKSLEVVFPLGNKLPVNNLPTSDNGPVARETREADLSGFLQRKKNILGRKIDSRFAVINQLKKNPSLISD